jgi:hypothetical protein
VLQHEVAGREEGCDVSYVVCVCDLSGSGVGQGFAQAEEVS